MSLKCFYNKENVFHNCILNLASTSTLVFSIFSKKVKSTAPRIYVYMYTTYMYTYKAHVDVHVYVRKHVQ
jgi:hypothetical protein